MINFTEQQLKSQDFLSELKDTIINNFCKDKERVSYLKRGASFEYFYYGNDDNLAGSFTIDTNACE